MVVNAEGMTLERFAKSFLFTGAGRPIVDKTGLAGQFIIHLEYAPDEEFRRRIAGLQGDPGDATAPNIFTAIQEQLGLKLESARAPVDVVVIDRLEKPSEN